MNNYVGNLYEELEIHDFQNGDEQLDNTQPTATICVLNVGACGANSGSCGIFAGICRLNGSGCKIDGGFY